MKSIITLVSILRLLDSQKILISRGKIRVHSRANLRRRLVAFV
jgi:hypothetical protein